MKPFCFRKGDDGTASSVRASSNRLTGGRGSAGADNQERALVIRGDGSTPTRAGTRDPQSSFSLRQVYTLAPSERRGVEALIKSPNHPHCGIAHVLWAFFYFGSTSALRRKASDGGGVPAEEDVSAASQSIISTHNSCKLICLKTGFTCGKYCMYCIVCQYGSRETIWEEVILCGDFTHHGGGGELECRKYWNTKGNLSYFHHICPT